LFVTAFLFNRSPGNTGLFYFLSKNICEVLLYPA